MRLTTSGLRSLLTNQAAFVAAARNVVAATSPQYGNPQRKWIEAAIRAYYRKGKDVDVLWATFDQKVQLRPMTTRRESNAAAAVRLLDQFLQWDAAVAELPVDAFPPIRDVNIGQHKIAVRRDLIYVDGSGYRVRQLWTDHQMRPDHPHAIQMAAAVLASVDADLGIGSTTEVDVWGLRHKRQAAWSRNLLISELVNLENRLNTAEQQIQQ